MVHVYNGILPSHKKNEILPFVMAWMDLQAIMQSEKVIQGKTNTIYQLYYLNDNINK